MKSDICFIQSDLNAIVLPLMRLLFGSSYPFSGIASICPSTTSVWPS